MNKIEIIIVTRGLAPYLKKSIESCLNQKENCKVSLLFTISKNYEKLNEEILNLCQENNVEIHYNYEDKGLFNNWNIALTHTVADYVCLFHDDDVMYPEFIKRNIEEIDNHPNCAFYHSKSNLIDSNGNTIKESENSSAKLTSGMNFLLGIVNSENINPVPISVVYNMKRLSNRKIFDVLHTFAGDLKCYLEISFNSEILYTEEILTGYRIHSNQTTNTINLIIKLKDRIRFLKYLFNRSENLPNYLKSFKYFFNAVLRDIYYKIT